MCFGLPNRRQADTHRIVLREIEQGEVTRKQRKKKPAEPSQESGIKTAPTTIPEPVTTGQTLQSSGTAAFY